MKLINYSFIIPHHNSPNLLNRLLKTIPEREDVEIIIADDNSDVDKKAVVNRDDTKVIYISKEETMGPGKARNIALSCARGKWIVFADADDLFKENFLSVLDDYKDSDIDMLYFNIEAVDSKTLKPCVIDRSFCTQLREYDGSKSKADVFLYKRFAPWRKMLRLDFIKHYNLKFDEFVCGEDTVVAVTSSYFANEWKVDKRTVYVVTFSENSISYTQSYPKYRDDIKTCLMRERFFAYIGHPEWNKSHILKFVPVSTTFKRIWTFIKQTPWLGIRGLLYYLLSRELRRQANHLIDEIEKRKV